MDARNEYARRYYAANRDKILARNRERYRAKRETAATEAGGSPMSGVFNSVKQGAERRGLVFELTRMQVDRLRNSRCVYCGRPANPPVHYTGLDRIDSAQGYTEENVVPACWDCNRCKGRLSKEQFIEHVARIVFWQIWSRLSDFSRHF